MELAINLGERQFMISARTLNNVEHTVLYDNGRIVGMLVHYQLWRLVFFDEELVNILFENPAEQFPDFINFMTVDNNNVPFEGIHDVFHYCQTTLYQLQTEFDPVLDPVIDPLGVD